MYTKFMVAIEYTKEAVQGWARRIGNIFLIALGFLILIFGSSLRSKSSHSSLGTMIGSDVAYADAPPVGSAASDVSSAGSADGGGSSGCGSAGK